MSEFEKELEKNMKLGKVAHERESLYSDFMVSKRDIERIFEDWQPSKLLVEVPRIVAKYIETQKDNNYNGNASLIVKHYDSFKDEGNDSELNIWIANNFNDFLNAIVNGYTVKKEKKYLLKHIDFCKTDKHYDWFTIKHSDGPLNHLRVEKGEKPSTIDCKFTQQEIDSMQTGSYEQIEVDE